MRIGCDVCRTAAAAVICCADEAALCAMCDEEVHAANMLAGKHRRLPLHCDAAKLPRCDICQICSFCNSPGLLVGKVYCLVLEDYNLTQNGLTQPSKNSLPYFSMKSSHFFWHRSENQQAYKNPRSKKISSIASSEPLFESLISWSSPPKITGSIHVVPRALAPAHQQLLLPLTFFSLLLLLPLTFQILPQKIQDKAAFIFCVEDRALFCQDCDEAIHIPGTLSANHQRLLATGIRVGLTSAQNTDSIKHRPEPPTSNSMASKISAKKQAPSASPAPAAWLVDDFLQLTDYESSYKETSAELEGLSWLADISFSPEEASKGSLSAAEVPEILQLMQPSGEAFYRLPRSSVPYKKARVEMVKDDDFFTVPDLG